MEFNSIDIFLWGFSAVYCLAAAGLAAALAVYDPERSDRKPFVSVLIAARNESAHMDQCLPGLLAQSYDADRFEVIVINDRSTDDTPGRLRAFEKQFRNLKWLTVDELPRGMAPKKYALNEGIKIAQGEIILCTDADCRAQKGWIAGMAGCFTDNVGAVVGYSPIEPGNPFSVFENFLALDSLALASVAAGSSAWNGTLTATGRSFVYRKRVFDEVGGFSRIARFISGDDDLLLGLIKKTAWKTVYCMEKNSLVETDPPVSFKTFINQKIRQASKGRHYSPGMIAGLFFVLIFNLLLITYLPWKWATGGAAIGNTFPWIIKVLSDSLIVAAGAWRFGKWSYLKMVPVIAALHPLYIVVFGIWGQFGKFEWKDAVSGRPGHGISA